MPDDLTAALRRVRKRQKEAKLPSDRSGSTAATRWSGRSRSGATPRHPHCRVAQGARRCRSPHRSTARCASLVRDSEAPERRPRSCDRRVGSGTTMPGSPCGPMRTRTMTRWPTRRTCSARSRPGRRRTRSDTSRVPLGSRRTKKQPSVTSCDMGPITSCPMKRQEPPDARWFSWWPGPGSNRRPSAFQADARTN